MGLLGSEVVLQKINHRARKNLRCNENHSTLVFYHNNQGFHAYDLTRFKFARYEIPGYLTHIAGVRIEMGKNLLVLQKETQIELMIIRD